MTVQLASINSLPTGLFCVHSLVMLRAFFPVPPESVCMALLSTALNETFVGSHAQQGKSDCSACQYVIVVCLWTQNEQFERIGIATSVSLLFYHKFCTLLRGILHCCCPFHTASSALSCVFSGSILLDTAGMGHLY